MGTRFGNTAVLDVVTERRENKQNATQGTKCECSHSVRVLDGGKTMCDGDGCATLGSVVEGGLDDLLGLRVESRSGLVKEQDLWISEKGTGDGDTLLLTSRQLGSLAADFGIESMR